MATRPGVLINANARGVRRDPGLAKRLLCLVPEERLRETATLEEVPDALKDLLDQEIDALVIVGGDGTLTGTLTPLLRQHDAATLPPVVPTRGGTVNTVATSLGARGGPEDTLSALASMR